MKKFDKVDNLLDQIEAILIQRGKDLKELRNGMTKVREKSEILKFKSELFTTK